MVDEVSRSAARIAALVAIPVALLTGIGLYALLSSATEDSGAPDPAGPTSPAAAAAPNTEPVPAPERNLTPRQETGCRGLLAQLPSELDGLVGRPVTAGPEQNAAYGDPPVTLACGVPAAEYPPTDELYLIVPEPGEAGVCWHAAEHPDQTVWTTVDRDIPVRVTVPVSHDAPGQLVAELTGTIVETVPPAEVAPTGCAPRR